MDQPGSDRTLEQFAFIFLVALGVDYNVFLLARIREERDRTPDTKAAVIAALERTGGVITSAGLVLAATFSVLMALPLESLFQVGFVVALGLLADTFLVRALLVPVDRRAARRVQLVAEPRRTVTRARRRAPGCPERSRAAISTR